MFSHFFPENRTVYEIMSKKCSGDRGATNDVTIWRIRVACWISKAICTCAHAHAHALGYPHARTHAQAFTHRPICNTSRPALGLTQAPTCCVKSKGKCKAIPVQAI
jgi:hypothetical protein